MDIAVDQPVKLPFTLVYSRGSVPTIDEVVESLQGAQAILKRMPRVLNRLYPGIDISCVEVLLNDVKTGSLYDDLIVEFIFGGKDQQNAFIQELRMKLGLDNKAVVYTVFFALLIAGGFAAYKFFSPSERAEIVNSYNTIINIAADQTGMKSSDIEAILDQALPKTEETKNAKDSLRVLNVGRAGGDLSVSQNDVFRVNSEFIQAIPHEIDEDLLDERYQEYPALKIDVRTINLDSKEKGWHALIEEISPKKRIKLVFGDGVDPASIRPGIPFRARAIVEYRVVDGKKAIRHCVVMEIINETDTKRSLPH